MNTSMEGAVATIIMTVALALIFLGFLIWGIRSGQFKNVEETKYQVFRKPPPDAAKPEAESRKK